MACNVWSATPDFRELFNTFFATQHSAFYTDFYSLSTAFRHFFGFLNIFLSFTLFFVYNFLETSEAGAPFDEDAVSSDIFRDHFA